MHAAPPLTRADSDALVTAIRDWAAELGFARVGITGVAPGPEEGRLESWLDAGCHGTMAWMARHGRKRSRPTLLRPGTRSVISVRMDYWPARAAPAWPLLDDGRRGYVARYALGRDYHKLVRKRLQRLAERIVGRVGSFGHRVFVDSAPVLEKPLAERAGLGWTGKHTNLISRDAGSWFFLGELYTDLDLPHDAPATDHCGTCRACIDVCPTRAIVAPYRLDARLCISYLTIEHDGPIPERLRPPIGNRIYGCDDCQLVCPWNRFATTTPESDFLPRHGLDAPDLVELFAWDESTFLARTEGSPIRRLGHVRWLRNLAVALGNGPADDAVRGALRARQSHPSELVREHVAWALARVGGETGSSS
ncbi:MAG: tRNA epoxyqueuosine(34) reductase QueG [Gammaproteobacteria bacterium]|nr:tRNA epoxyqueuosine(34) reductase QueG [Gammaproteobacteria bacterium]